MILSFGFIIALMIVANAYLLFELYSLLKAARANLASDIQSIDLAKRLQALLYEEERSGQKYLITRDTLYYDLFEAANGQFQRDLESLAKLESGKQERNLIQQVSQKHAWLLGSLAKSRESGRRSIPPGDATIDRVRRETVKFLDYSLDRLIKLNQISIDSSMRAWSETAMRSSRIAVALTLLTLLAASAAAWIIARTITGPIRKVILATQQIAKGSFQPIGIASNDETAILANAVNQMGDQLKKHSEFKTDLMRQVVHELRQPLQVIFSAQALLAEQQIGGLNSKQLEMLHLIEGNVDKLLRFTNQFLDLAKIDAGMMAYRLLPTDLLSVVTQAVGDAKVLASQKAISVVLSSSNSAPQVLADAEKLSQVFGNLLSNAVKYTGRGGTIEVTVSCSQKCTQVAVRDSGTGIAAEDLPKLFTKFYQAANAFKAGSVGTGLGLALVKAFVEAHGGSISVESSPGAGSTFTVELPLANKEEDLVETLEVANKPSLAHG